MEALAARCLAHAPLDGANPTPIPGVSVYRRDQVTEPGSAVYAPCLFLVVQGRKQAEVGDDTYVYDADRYLVSAVPLPVVSRILVAEPAQPFLSLAVKLDLDVVRELLAVAADVLAPSAPGPPLRGLAACPVTAPIRDVTARLVGLLDRPDDVVVLGPLYVRELLYRVLAGPQGGFIRAAVLGHGPHRAIADVLTTIHADCAQAFAVPELAQLAAMSESAFYEAFRSVTGSSPKRYIQRLRLQEAHRQLTLGLTNVSGAAYAVGYNSHSQFSREFTRAFGVNPRECLPA